MRKIVLKLKAEELKRKLNIKDGKTPIAGIDFPLPIKGIDYFDGEKGKDIEESVVLDLENKIEELKEYLEEKIKEIKPTRTVVLGGRKDMFMSEEPTGTVDGVNDTFYLSATPRENSLFLMWQGQGQRPTATTEYTITGKKIIFNAGSIPTAGSLWANYVKF